MVDELHVVRKYFFSAVKRYSRVVFQDFLWSIDGSRMGESSGSEDTTDIFIMYALTALVNLSAVRSAYEQQHIALVENLKTLLHLRFQYPMNCNKLVENGGLELLRRVCEEKPRFVRVVAHIISNLAMYKNLHRSIASSGASSTVPLNGLGLLLQCEQCVARVD